MKSIKQIKYECAGCQTKWFEQLDAVECCAILPEEIIFYECSKCDKEFDTEHDANECCANKKLK